MTGENEVKEIRRRVRGLRQKLVSVSGEERREVARELGRAAARLAELDPHAGLDLCRRLVWTLNPDSGEMGWGSPEALGASLAESQLLAHAFGRLMVSLVAPGRNQLDHPDLLAGAAWGLALLRKARPESAPGADEALAWFESKEA